MRNWRRKDEFIRDILLWTLSLWRAKAGRPAKTYIQQFCVDTGCNLEDLPGAMDDRDRWQERVREVRAGSVTWWGCISLQDSSDNEISVIVVWANYCFHDFVDNITAVTLFGRPYIWNICPIFYLCIKPNTWEKSTKKVWCGMIISIHVYIYIYIYIDICVLVFVCVGGWVAKEGILCAAFSRGTPLSILAWKPLKCCIHVNLR